MARNLEELTGNLRVTVRRAGPPNPEGRCVVYWMQRAQRALDNPALDVAVEAANALGKPVVAYLGIVPFYPNANLRHYAFLVQGIPDLARRLARRGVGLVVRRYPDHQLVRFCDEVRPSLVVGDENPMREPERWRLITADRLRVPLWTVDADVIVPTKLLGKEHYAARTIRPNLRGHLDEFLRPLRNPRPRVKWKAPRGTHSLRPDSDLLDGFPIDRSVQLVSTFRGGTDEGLHALRRFVRERLKGYATRRNRPELDGTSQLSPYLHFGHVGPHTVALAVRDADAPREDREAFLEELIVRRELAIDFVRFNPRYDRLESCEPWALRTLGKHRRDQRAHLYTERQLESAQTHDPLWNAAQQQMVVDGWMHGYLRMYWAKKILEWTRTPEEAYDIAVHLNDRYELDGRDPNGYAGVAWAIGGKHDRAWGPERPVFGMIRYMSYASTSRKFDNKAYIARARAQSGERGGQ
jgi:deoxyribodipyrimidine photo-lyase